MPSPFATTDFLAVNIVLASYICIRKSCKSIHFYSDKSVFYIILSLGSRQTKEIRQASPMRASRSLRQMQLFEQH